MPVDPSVNSQAELELREELLRVQEEKNASLKKEGRLQDSFEESKATVESLKSKSSDQKSQALMDLTNQAERAKAEANATLETGAED